MPDISDMLGSLPNYINQAAMFTDPNQIGPMVQQLGNRLGQYNQIWNVDPRTITPEQLQRQIQAATSIALQGGEGGLKLGPAMPSPDLPYDLHSILDESGKQTGMIALEPDPGAERLHVALLRNEGGGSLVPVFRQLKDAYPWAKKISGYRITGLHQGNVEFPFNP